MKRFLCAAIFIVLTGYLFPQQYLEKELQNRPEELVTLSANISFNDAIDLLNKVSLRSTGKSIVSTVPIAESIGLQIDNMNYYKALILLVQYQGLMFEEKEDVIIIKRKNEPAQVERSANTYASVNEREIKISAILFEMDVNESRERGIDWQVILSGNGGSIGGMLGIDETKQTTGGTGGSGTEAALPEFNVDVSTDFNAGNFFGEATAVFKFFESENLGEIISSPNITVRDRQQARLQVGSDISIKQKDFAGNVIEQFFSTGTIIEVTPYVYKEDGVDYILSNIKVVKSSYVPDQTTTVITKTEASTQVVMLNGEETVIGGLFINDEDVVRNGIPFLKDLPWWFFGLRYVFGSDQTVVTKKELVILIKAELIPTLKERLAWPQAENKLEQELKTQREKIKFYQFKQSDKTEKQD